MLGKQSGQVDVFNHMIYERLIPKNHLLLKIDSIMDFSFVYQITEKFYSPVGRASYDPTMLFKICLLEYIYNLSDVKVVERIQTDIAFRWFLKLSLDDSVPDATTISFFRCNRLGDKPFEDFFNEIVRKCIDADIVKTKTYIMDSTHVAANVNYPSQKKILCNAFRRLIKELNKIDEIFATEKLNQFETDIENEYKVSDKVSMETYCTIAQKYANQIYISFNSELNKNSLLQDRFNIFQTIIKNYGEGSSSKDRIISCIDPDSRVAHKSAGNRKTGYKNHIIIDVESEIILASTQTPFNVGDEKELVNLIHTVDENFKIKPKEVSADKVYGSTSNRAYLKDNEITCNILFYDNENVEYETFSLSRFDISEDLQSAVCPNGCTSISSSANRGKRPQIIIKFSSKDCMNCPLKEKCIAKTTLKVKEPRKILRVDIRYDAVITGIKRNKTPEFKVAINNRYKIERRFATMVRNHGLRRSRYLRLSGAKIHIALANTACNIIRMVKILYDNQPIFAMRKI